MDEIANIPLAQQAKLLRVIETGDFERVGSSKTSRKRAHHFRYKCKSGKRDCSGSFSAGPPFSPQYDSDRIAAVARSTRGYHAAGEHFFDNMESVIAKTLAASMKTHVSVYYSIGFPEISGNSIISLSVQC